MPARHATNGPSRQQQNAGAPPYGARWRESEQTDPARKAELEACAALEEESALFLETHLNVDVAARFERLRDHTRRSRPSQYGARISRFRSLPDGLRGTSATKSTVRGRL